MKNVKSMIGVLVVLIVASLILAVRNVSAGDNVTGLLWGVITVASIIRVILFFRKSRQN